jgi:leader peptidase (prepilin peptidase)/N-methyltransferase
LIYAALAALLIVISMIDLRHMIIPNGLIISGLVVGAANLLMAIFTPHVGSWTDYAIGFFAGGLPLFIISLFCTYLLKKEAVGGGDIKLMAMAGLIIGWKLIATAYLVGIILGAVISVILIAARVKSRGDEIPFGPFLSLGILISIFFGADLINWYLGLL